MKQNKENLAYIPSLSWYIICPILYYTVSHNDQEQFVIKHLPPSWTTDPSSSTFAITWALFTLTATTIYHLHRNDTYQDYVLAVIVAGCVIWSLIIGEQTVIEILGVSLPRFIALGLFLSIVVHMMGGQKKMNRQQDGQEEILVAEKEKYAGQP